MTQISKTTFEVAIDVDSLSLYGFDKEALFDYLKTHSARHLAFMFPGIRIHEVPYIKDQESTLHRVK